MESFYKWFVYDLCTGSRLVRSIVVLVEYNYGTSANNRFNSGQGYTYDLSGNTVSDAEGRAYIYDAENKQKQVKNSANQTIGTYFYGGEQQRAAPVKQTHQEGNGIKDNNICLWRRREVGGGIFHINPTDDTRYKIFDKRSPRKPADNNKPDVGDARSQGEATPVTRYLTSDHLGSPRIIAGSNGAVLSRRDFMPYGEEAFIGVGNRAVGHGYTYGDSTRQKFTGYERDEETNLDFAQARCIQIN